MGFLKVDMKKIGMVAAGGAIGGVLAYEVDKYAKTVPEGKTKPNIGFIADHDYITGLVIAVAGLFLANFGFDKKQGMLEGMGYGMVAAGLADSAEKLMAQYAK